MKLQKRSNRILFTKQAFDQPYINENSFGETYGLHREALEFDMFQYRELKEFAQQIGVIFFATAFDIPSVDFLAELDMPAIKIASGDLRSLALLEYAAGLQKPIILSTGGGTMDQVRRAHECITAINPQLCLLQCTAAYPPSWDQLDLKVIETFRNEFENVVVGYSAHDGGIAMALVAFVLGARVIEKHFTLDRAMKGTDHALSLEPLGLQKLSRDLNRAHISMGDGIKKSYKSEAQPLLKMGKMLVAKTSLPAGHTVQASDVDLKSPADGMWPDQIDQIIGKQIRSSMEPELPFTWESFTN